MAKLMAKQRESNLTEVEAIVRAKAMPLVSNTSTGRIADAYTACAYA